MEQHLLNMTLLSADLREMIDIEGRLNYFIILLIAGVHIGARALLVILFTRFGKNRSPSHS
jgi:hypothetical protein